MGVKHHLKQHFIPHAGNNYHPHILHAKRAVFYGGFFMALKAFLVVFAVILPTEAFLAPDVLAEQHRRLIALTNDLRAERGLPVLSEEMLLDRSSGMKADDMSAQGYFSHTSPDGHKLSYFLGRVGYEYRFAGENLAVGFSDAADVVEAWKKSATHYANLVDGDFEQFGIGLAAGVYDGQPTVFVAQHFGSPIKKVVKQESPSAPSAPASQPIAKAPVQEKPVAVATAPVAKPVKRPQPVVQARPVVEPASVAATSTPAVLEAPVAATGTEIAVSSSSTEPLSMENGETASTSSVLSASESNAPTDLISFSENGSVSWASVGSTRTAMSAEVQVPGEVKEAFVTANGYRIPLIKGEGGVYRGSITAPVSSKDLFKTVVSPSLEVVYQDGTRMQGAVPWDHPKLNSQTPWERYLQANSWLSSSMPLFPAVRAIYWFALLFFSVALALNIFIEIKKQHPHVIAQTVSLLGLIALMIWK